MPKQVTAASLIILATLITASYAHRELLEPNRIISINTRNSENAPIHQTTLYKKLGGRALVLRRGEIFNVSIKLKHAFDTHRDKLRLEFAFGPRPALALKTLIYLPIEDQLDKSRWSATIDSRRDDINVLSISINLPPTMPIGTWTFRITTKLVGTKLLETFSSVEPIYIIFNPWCSADQVYLANQDARHEYTLNQIGKIYIGSHNRPIGREWAYDQFDPSVLEATMLLLDRILYDPVARSDVVKVSRAVSALVNANDDGGLVVGNWSGSYRDGLAPWQWSGSAPIFRKYLINNMQPIKFGQCWVFGGITTTALRTLGIPARTISNFLSAHDTDQSLTVDKFFSEYNEPMEGVNGDSVWNFHVWSEAWMVRNDLPPGYGGWQAIDGTPQERSNGVHQLGPASLEAVKQGKVNFAYDVNFVYSEVNADLIHWREDSRSRWGFRKSRVDLGHVGRRILTKKIGLLGRFDHEDITSQYKYPEGSREESAARDHAIGVAGLSLIQHK